jgi:hypothetical protein
MKGVLLFIAAVLAFSTACGRVSERADPPHFTPTVVSSPEADSSEPAIAADADNIYVAYVAHNSKESTNVLVQKFTIDAKLAGPAVRVNPIEGSARSWYGDPPTIAVAGDTVYVGWTASVEGGTELFLSVSHDGGATFDGPVKVNDDKRPAAHGMHSLAVDRSGKIYMAWLDERNVPPRSNENTTETQGTPKAENASYPIQIHHKDADHMSHDDAEPNSEVYFAVSADGGKTFSANKKLAGEACPCCKTSMAVGPDGKLFVSWRQVLANGCRHIAVASSSDGGELFSQPVIVSDDKWKINACPVSGAAMAVDASSALNVAWYTAGDAGQPGLYSAISSDGARSFAPRTLESSDAISGTPTLLETDNGTVSIFGAGSSIRVRAGDTSHMIENAEFPAAALANGKIFVAFVRKQGERREIEIASF